MDMYERLAGCGINFDDFSKGEKLFEDDREKFMNFISLMRARANIVDRTEYCIEGTLNDVEISPEFIEFMKGNNAEVRDEKNMDRSMEY